MLNSYCFVAYLNKNGKNYKTPLRIHGFGTLEEALDAADFAVTARHGGHAYGLFYVEGLYTLDELRELELPAGPSADYTPPHGGAWQFFILDRNALEESVKIDC